MTHPIQERKHLVRSVWNQAWDNGDVDALDELIGPAYRRRTNGDRTVLDLQNFKVSILGTRQAFPDLRTTIDTVIAEDDLMAIAWHSEGRHEGELMGVPPTGKEVLVFGSNYVRFENDLIVEEAVTWDPRQLLAAIGIISLGDD